MIKFENFGHHFAAIVCTIVLSTTMIVGAVGPAAVSAAPASEVVRAIA